MGKLVQEKRETGGTAAKAGVFWALIAVPIFLLRKLRTRKKR